MNKSSISTLVQEYLHTYNESLLVEIENHVRLAFGLNRVDGDQLQLPEERINKNKNNNTDYAACMTTQIDKARNIDEHMYRQTVDKNNKIIKEFPSSDESIIKIVSTTMFKDFVHSIRKIVPAITEKDCAGLLRDSITIGKILCDTELTDFDKHVVENLVRKHKALFANEVLNHTTYKLSDLDLEMIKHVPQGGSWKDIPEETIHKSKRLERITQTGGRTTLYGRIDYSKPSYTITTFFNRPGNGTYVHPVHERVISAREAARFQTFPDDYIFCGNKNDILKQIGNAVPVLLAYNIGTAIRNKTGCCASVDLFSGAGGMTYGFKCAGIKATIANDIMRSACLTLKTNMPDINVLCGDITKKEIKRTIITTGKSGGADIICGGPPCQGFSMAGWRMENDPRNELFKHFVDIVSEIRPKVIVFENVEGLLSYKNGETYRNIIELFSELGYFTEGRKLKANHYGVPQRRNRVIILCTRKDINVPPKDLFPEPTTPNTDRQITAFETISDLENIPCDDNAKNHSNYSSPILQFLKKEITAHEYIQSIRDERGELACTAKTKMKKNSEQLLFDFFA